jgi:hypothetical protein
MKKVIVEWNIPIIVTDNGSNMIKAFQLAATPEHIEEVINDVALGREENIAQVSNVESDEKQDSLFTESDDSIYASSDILHFDASLPDDYLESDQVIFIPPSLMPENQSGANAFVEETEPWETNTEEILQEETEIHQDVLQLLDQEKEIESATKNLGKKSKRMRRIPCLSHSLQVVMAVFYKYRVKHLNKLVESIVDHDH